MINTGLPCAAGRTLLRESDDRFTSTCQAHADHGLVLDDLDGAVVHLCEPHFRIVVAELIAGGHDG